jgi:hypothetical protein
MNWGRGLPLPDELRAEWRAAAEAWPWPSRDDIYRIHSMARSSIIHMDNEITRLKTELSRLKAEQAKVGIG